MKQAIYIFLAILLTLNFNISPVLADWTEPPANPPSNNRPEPLDVSVTSQTKIGSLQIGPPGTLTVSSIQGPAAFTGTLTVSSSENAVQGISSGLNNAGVFGQNTAGGWAGSFAGYLGGYNLTIGGAGQTVNSGYLNNGDAYFYGKINVVGDAKAGSLTLGGQRITSWSQAGTSLWTDATTYIYPNNANGVLVYDNNSFSVCESQCIIMPAGYNLISSNFNNSSNRSIAVYGAASGSDSVGIYGSANGANSYAGYFSGNVNTTGMTTLGSAGLNLTAGQNLLYGNIDITSVGNLLLLQTENVDKLKVDKSGNISAGGNIVANGLIQGSCGNQGVGGIKIDNSYIYDNSCGGSDPIPDASTLYITSGDDIKIKRDDNNYLYLKTSGIGIGTMNPNAKLEVAGQIKITGGSPGANKVLTSDAAGLATWQTPASGLPTGTSGQTLRHDGSNWVANSTLYNNGTNVGIGTANPSQKLEVSNTNLAIASIRSLSSLNTAGDDLAALYFGDNYGAGQSRILVERDAVGSGGDNPTNISFWTTPDGSTTAAERLRIDNQGRVGIGTAGPSKLFHVYKASGDNAEIDIQSVAGTNQYWAIYHDRTTDDLRFWNDDVGGDDNLLTLTNEGGVGIGTANPAGILEVTKDQNLLGSNIPLVYLSTTGSAATTKGSILHLYTTRGTGTEDVDLFKVYNSAGSTFLTVRNAGNVGIGTANPGNYRLNIQGGDVSISSQIKVFGTGDNIFQGMTSFGVSSPKQTGMLVINLTSTDQNIIYGAADINSSAQTAGLIKLEECLDNDPTSCEERFKVDLNGNTTISGSNSPMQKVIISNNIGNTYIDYYGGSLFFRNEGQNPNPLTIKNDNNVEINNNLDVNGTTLMGYEVNNYSCGTVYDCTILCSSGKKILGGGCEANNNITSSRPFGDNGWYCSTVNAVSKTVYAICARVGD